MQQRLFNVGSGQCFLMILPILLRFSLIFINMQIRLFAYLTIWSDMHVYRLEFGIKFNSLGYTAAEIQYIL